MFQLVGIKSPCAWNIYVVTTLKQSCACQTDTLSPSDTATFQCQFTCQWKYIQRTATVWHWIIVRSIRVKVTLLNSVLWIIRHSVGVTCDFNLQYTSWDILWKIRLWRVSSNMAPTVVCCKLYLMLASAILAQRDFATLSAGWSQ